MWPQALSVPSVWRHTVCAVNPDPVCRAVLPSAAGSYITVPITATRITCGALTDTYSFSPAFPRSVAISSSPLALVSSPPNLSYFHLAQLNALFKRFVSLCLFSLSVATSSLFAPFIGVTLAASQNSLLLLIPSPLLPLFLSFSLSSLSVAIYLPSPCKSLFLSPSLSVWAPAQILQMLLHTG